MATLEQPRIETVASEIITLLRHIGQQDFATRFYLAGGTALALQLGRREFQPELFAPIEWDTVKKIFYRAGENFAPRLVWLLSE